MFDILKENNPELTGEKRRTIMKPPQVHDLKSSCAQTLRNEASRHTWLCMELTRYLAMSWLSAPIFGVVQVAREGTKKTVFTNYMELCKAMNRQPEHVQLFLLAELGTSGSLDGQSRLIVKGRFQPKAFEGVLRRYVNE